MMSYQLQAAAKLAERLPAGRTVRNCNGDRTRCVIGVKKIVFFGKRWYYSFSMSYKVALDKAWTDISKLTEDKKLSVRFMADEYDVDLENKKIFSAACNIPAKEHISVILLHYLIQKLRLRVLPKPAGNWISFKQVDGGDGYYPTFKQRTIDVVLRKYGSRPEALLEATERFNARKVPVGDMGIIIEPFEDVPFFITLWKGSEEFGPDANIVFDENVYEIFCTEDIVVLAEIIAHAL